MTVRWTRSWRADPEVRPLADRHYNRQKIGAKQFAPPGRALVLKRADAFWITSYPFAQFVRHRWAGAWVCSAFRRERDLPGYDPETLSSELIREAVAATRWFYGRPPPLGMVTFVDATKTRAKRDPGRCFRRAGFVEVGRTETDDLVVLQMFPWLMPPPAPPHGAGARHKDYEPEP